ncbi:ISNCY family transposase [Persicobacter sp. CCB-QB2]|uniref:ISNCY family transposase n=1 Tax=Persicobacter sp. CCB-QB2 TaxID=1561025 RepID=UPI0006A9BF16|nr:ISNCY family transposase [Persicobacter sp. CCB-QB2]
MRSGFTQQLKINTIPISEVQFPSNTRDHIVNLLRALQAIYMNKEISVRIEKLLQEAIGTSQTSGRKGMGLWEVFVLAQLRLCQNLSYDDLLNLANYNVLVRRMLGKQINLGLAGESVDEYTFQNIYDNVSLVDDETLKKINAVIVEFGHGIFKKKDSDPLSLKTDSFVVETNTTFPSDYVLLFEAGRKCLNMIGEIAKQHKVKGWREVKSESSKLKSLCRSFGRATSAGGKNKAKNEIEACQAYLNKAKSLYKKVADFWEKDMPALLIDQKTLLVLIKVEWFKLMFEKHINLLERRIIGQEKIPASEKVYSLYLPFTEWIKKGKKRPPIEIGKKLFVTTDQFGLIVDHCLGDNLSDRDSIMDIIDRVLEKYQLVSSWSTDKGFSSKENKALIQEVFPDLQLIMPKLGKRNKTEEAEEKSKPFKLLKNAHSAIESNINELENRGLDRCPNRSPEQFRNYVALGITAYNLHKIGKRLNEIKIKKEKTRYKKIISAA